MTITYHSVTMSELRAPRTHNTCLPVCTEAYKSNARVYERRILDRLHDDFGKALDQIKKEGA